METPTHPGNDLGFSQHGSCAIQKLPSEVVSQKCAKSELDSLAKVY